jgi:hypothetical protein
MLFSSFALPCHFEWGIVGIGITGVMIVLVLVLRKVWDW